VDAGAIFPIRIRVDDSNAPSLTDSVLAAKRLDSVRF
jgi:hypothetical protein